MITTSCPPSPPFKHSLLLPPNTPRGDACCCSIETGGRPALRPVLRRPCSRRQRHVTPPVPCCGPYALYVGDLASDGRGTSPPRSWVRLLKTPAQATRSAGPGWRKLHSAHCPPMGISLRRSPRSSSPYLERGERGAWRTLLRCVREQRARAGPTVSAAAG